jgi:butyryl-CoA dehydrogenase
MALVEEQEILGGLADMAIDLFAAETVLLRAAKADARRSGERAAVTTAMACLFTARALGRIEAAARPILAAVASGDELRVQLALVRRFTRHLPANTIALQRQVAAAVTAREGYPV